MFGRKTYTREELDNARAGVARQLAAHDELAAAATAGSGAKKAAAALAEFEPLFFNNMTLVLDRLFVHRLRVVTGKDMNPLNEVELLSDSLMNNGGVLRAGNVVKHVPEQSVVRLKVGDPIRLTRDDFERLSTAVFAEIERKFVTAG
ncbi:MAG TPA: hypothetical protein VF076_06455 [Acidimicrobiales bacterium]